MKKLMIQGNVVTPNRVFDGTVVVIDGKIADVFEGKGSIPEQYANEKIEFINVKGDFIMPGLVDFHCDMLENAIQPRKNVFFPITFALQSIQAQYLSSGITSVFHPVSFSGEPGLRSNETAEEIIKSIVQIRNKDGSRIRHFIHARYELSNESGLDAIIRTLENRSADLFSIMDHSPRYTKFKTYGEYKSYIEKNSTLKGDELELYTRLKWENSDENESGIEEELIEFVEKYKVIFATHDDDSPERTEKYRKIGSSISEFPLNEETARHAVENGMYSVMGAPNLLRNKSHAGNIGARYAVKKGLANILCSDYYCFSLLASVFTLYMEGMELEKAVSLVTINPASALGISDRIGSIEKGKEADIIIVHYSEGQFPLVEKAMVAGKWTYDIQY